MSLAQAFPILSETIEKFGNASKRRNEKQKMSTKIKYCLIILNGIVDTILVDKYYGQFYTKLWCT